MKLNVLVTLLVGLALGGVNVAHAQTAAPTTQISGKLGQPIQLFNGKDLNGWAWFTAAPATNSATPRATMEDVWTIKDGILHLRGTPNGYLHTEKVYENYVLTVEQRHVKTGNGGIFVAISGPDKIWPKSLEIQGAAGGEGNVRGIADFKLNLDPARAVPRQLNRIGQSVTKPIGEWDTVVAVVDHNSMTVTINGQLQNQLTSNESLAGMVGIQSEGGEMEFRKFELTPIEAK